MHLMKILGSVFSRLKAGQKQHLAFVHPGLHDSTIHDPHL
jgi:hypothetical protein